MAVSSNTIEILIHATDMATSTINNISDSSAGLGANLTKTGLQLTVATAAITGAIGVSTNAAIKYEETMTNTAAVLGQTREEQEALEDQILDFSRNTRAGPQQVAEAYYDIVGGVADATTHMAILEAATLTADAGNVNLADSTSSLISLMNAYSFEAEDAIQVANVMTATVGAGVGTMGEFANAFPKVAGLASTLNIPLETVGGSLALLTTKGFTASESATKLKASMAALVGPNATMTLALEELGYASGEAAIEELGLVGAMEAVAGTNTVAEEGLLKTVGSLEALDATLALTGEGAEEFLADFEGSIDGAAEAAADIQMGSAAAQMALLNSSIEAISIVIGQALLPGINRMIERIRPVLDFVFEWMQANPELTSSLVMLASAIAALGPVLMIAGGAIGILTSPLTLVIAGMVALGLAFATNFGGIRDTVLPIVDIVMIKLQVLADWFLVSAVPAIIAFITDTAIPMLLSFVTTLGDIWDIVSPALLALGNWFLTDVVPAIVAIIQDSLIPMLIDLGQFLSSFWEIVGPHLQNLGEWFLETVLPAIVTFVTTIVVPGIKLFIDLLGAIWTVVGPVLLSLTDWFLNTGLPIINNFIQDIIIPGTQMWIDILVSIWEIVQPVLQGMFDWFMTTGLPLIDKFIKEVIIPGTQMWIDILLSIWEIVQPPLNSLLDFIVETGLPLIKAFFDDILMPTIQSFIDLLGDIWTLVQPALQSLASGIASIFGGIEDAFNFVIDGMLNSINTLIKGFNEVSSAVGGPTIGLITTSADREAEATKLTQESYMGAVVPLYSNYREMQEQGLGDMVEGFAGGTSWTGSGSAGGVAGVVHNREGVIPESGAPLIVPTPNGFELQGGIGEGQEDRGAPREINIQVDVSERSILTEEQARSNGQTLATEIVEEIRYSG